MSAYKKLNKEDSFLTTYTAHKSFILSGSQHDAGGIETYVGVSSSLAFHPTGSTQRLAGTNFVHYQDLVYRSIKHLYYSGFDNAEPATSTYDMSGSSVENYLQSTYTSQQRRAEDRFAVISIPRNLIGTHIKPESVVLRTPESTNDDYGQINFTFDDYMENVMEHYGAEEDSEPTATLDPQDFINGYRNLSKQAYLSASLAITDPWQDTIVDDGNGNLILSSSVQNNLIMEKEL